MMRVLIADDNELVRRGKIPDEFCIWFLRFVFLPNNLSEGVKRTV
jgi:hypothetical protein